MVLGYMPMPANFRYREVALRGRPQHKGWDAFSIKHPPMPASRWAKIFSPFDALKGFSEAVAAKQEEYEPRRELLDEEKQDLDQKISALKISNSENLTMVQIEYYVPCTDPAHDAYGKLDQYRVLTGAFMGADMIRRTITVNSQIISAEDISDIVILPQAAPSVVSY